MTAWSQGVFGSSATSWRARLAILLLVFFAYVASFPFLYSSIGDMVFAVGLFPAAASGWLFGVRAGVLVGALVCLLNSLPIFPGGHPTWSALQAAIGSASVIGMGAMVGYVRDFGERWRRELAARSEAEKSFERSRREMATVGAISQALAKSISLEDVLNTVLDRSLEAMNLSTGGIYLVSSDARNLRLAVCSGMTEEALKEVSDVPIGTGICGKAAHSGETVVMNDVAAAPDAVCLPGAYLNGMKAVVAVPIRAKAATVGVLVACSHDEGITDGNVRLLDVIANQVGSFIQNAQLYERVSQLSVTDDLTGLRNRRRFNRSVEEEINRAQRDGKPFCLVMLDLDSFKAYNDSHGHPGGDELLQVFARSIESALRKTDMAFRLGGDEFSIILTGTVSAAAMKVIERLSSSWEAAQASLGYSEDFPVGFSVGVAEFPRDGQTAEELFFAADASLYEDKASKRPSRAAGSAGEAS